MFSPLEQFELFALWSNAILVFFHLTACFNLAVFYFVFFVLSLFVLYYMLPVRFILDTRFIAFNYLMNLAVFCRSILFSALNDLYFTRQYFVVFYAVFFFLISSNLIGLLPFAFTVTSQIILTFGLSFFLFFAANWLAVQRHGLNYFSLFLPSGSPFFMSFLLVPIEIISYVARVFSLSIRLFANMMAGHCLLKIIAGFAWTMLLMGGLISFFFVVPYVVVVLVTVLELIVAFLQAYVYCLLLSIYIRDCVYLH